MSVESAALVRGQPGPVGEQTIQRMAVGWQNPVTRAVDAVGLLEYDGTVHRFRYLRRSSRVPGFRPFIGFPRLHGEYRSEELFPLFAQRVMSPKRPDYSRYLRSVDLTDRATTWEQLARTEGRLASDTIHLVPEPLVGNDGWTVGCFLVAGIRHRLPDVSFRDQVLGSIHSGDLLEIRDQPDNPKNPRAVLVTSRGEVDLGWVPDMLVDHVHRVRAGDAASLRVRHVNGPEAPPHMRLLVELSGRMRSPLRPFDGPGWETFG